jgi:hypothetical protein
MPDGLIAVIAGVLISAIFVYIGIETIGTNLGIGGAFVIAGIAGIIFSFRTAAS